MGETERSLKARFEEHQHPSSNTSEESRHINTDYQGHTIHIEETKILTVSRAEMVPRGLKRL